MSRVGMSSVDRFPRVNTPPCQYTSVEELGWYALVNEYEDPDLKDYDADNNRRTLRRLSSQWRDLRDFDLDDSWSFFERYAQAFPTGVWKPLFNMRSWIQNNMQPYNEFRPNIVCSGGHLKYIMEIPNTVIPNLPDRAQSERLNYVACKRQGVIYLARTKFGDSTSASKKSYRKHRFEQLVTRTVDGTQENPALGMTKFEYSYSVLGRTIGKTRVLYSQQIDCIDSHIGRPVNLDVVEMIQPDNKPFCSWKEQNQTRSTWTRCFLGGSAGTLRGTRKDAQLMHCEWIRTEDIPDRSTCPKRQRCCYHWSKERNIRFLDEFLEFVQATVTKDYERYAELNPPSGWEFIYHLTYRSAFPSINYSSVYGFLVDYSDQENLITEAVEWTAGSTEFENNNILRRWGGEAAWPVLSQPAQHDFNETLQRTYAAWKASKLV